VERVARAGLEVIVVDVTAPDIREVGLNVVRAIVPGCQPHENSRIVASAPRVLQSSDAVAASQYGFKRYVYSPSISLPTPDVSQDPLLVSISRRQSMRSYAKAPLSLGDIAAMTYAAVGIVDGGRRRAIPSAGGLYPLELYVVALDVEGLAAGIHHYNVLQHRLTCVRAAELRSVLETATFAPEALQSAAAGFALTGVFGRSKIKYGERAYRFALLEAGHAMQNIMLAAQSRGLGVCPIGGFVDDEVNGVLEVDGVEEAVLYLAAAGRMPRDENRAVR
jgi:SagB-type dehydrogenase family enzyme